MVERLTKIVHFLLFSTKWSVAKLARCYVREVVRLHDVSVNIVSDRDAKFTFKFWEIFQEAMGTHLQMSLAYHPQTDR